ncbi:methionyl-tRNA formyltransferase [Aestuariirhabdus litorea]|uniref:Methionyl-tRNA formyltransferase n=1 Tax=Aestuariirhabdus litorea TaxID=2528527 RepID=A0A3P3VIT3_9GAMM|nr:methionyl-tRNA formyltransferase [Aestuariirhabdus litorea]RRJ82582.1 methionyl-tRNA formyltransferase [Aestuariirhabdus litorea]RWW92740.1 methionyl-tRNA formyltransferase [Endozoicomonadaceae bacterium GTF-13]
MSRSPLRILFAGTPDFAAHHLQVLIDSPHEVVGAYTQPDRPAGRGRKLTPSPVKALAIQHGIPVEQPLSLKSTEAQATLSAFNADLMVVVAYGLLLPQAVLDAPRLGCINVHASLLPRWRGAAPIQRAIAAGDLESGVTIMQMDAGLDTGDMLVTVACPILPTDTASDLHDRLQEIGGPALLEAIDELSSGSTRPQPQDSQLANYAHKLHKSEAELDFTQPAELLARQVRAFNPWPVSYCLLDGERVRIWEAQPLGLVPSAAPGTILASSAGGIDVACGEGALRLLTLQFPGAKSMAARDLLNSRATQLAPQRRFG